MDSLQSKGYRILSMFDRLLDGEGINKRQEAVSHSVGEKTIQRDLDVIRLYLDEVKADCRLQYDRSKKIYNLTKTGNNRLSKEQVLVIVKILIESRALLKDEMSEIIDELISLVAEDNQEFIHNLILNEKHLYVDLGHKKSLLSLIWDISLAVQKKKLVNITYLREGATVPSNKQLKPIGVIFSEYYFYMIAYDINQEKDIPIVYRIDRIHEFQMIDKQFKIPYSERFQEGEFRKRIQFMHAGELMRIKFTFKGTSPQAVLDRLPTATKVNEDDGVCIFEAEVFGHGIKMWLLSQGENIEVLEPKELREDIKETLFKMLSSYA